MPDWTANASLAEVDVLTFLPATLHVVIRSLDSLMATITTLECRHDILPMIPLQIVTIWASWVEV